jgi:hypothetical protein
MRPGMPALGLVERMERVREPRRRAKVSGHRRAKAQGQVALLLPWRRRWEPMPPRCAARMRGPV